MDTIEEESSGSLASALDISGSVPEAQDTSYVVVAAQEPSRGVGEAREPSDAVADVQEPSAGVPNEQETSGRPWTTQEDNAYMRFIINKRKMDWEEANRPPQPPQHIPVHTGPLNWPDYPPPDSERPVGPRQPFGYGMGYRPHAVPQPPPQIRLPRMGIQPPPGPLQPPPPRHPGRAIPAQVVRPRQLGLQHPIADRIEEVSAILRPEEGKTGPCAQCNESVWHTQLVGDERFPRRLRVCGHFLHCRCLEYILAIGRHGCPGCLVFFPN